MLALFIAWFPFSDLHYNAQQHAVAQFTPQLVSVGDIIAQQRLCVEGEESRLSAPQLQLEMRTVKAGWLSRWDVEAR